MNIKVLKDRYAICRLESEDMVPLWVDTKNFISITRTEDELSIVCIDKNISGILAKEKISIFVVSTFDTDYILVKEENLVNSIKVLSDNNINII